MSDVPVTMHRDSVVTRDGTTLEMNVFLPQDASSARPALVTYIPYLKDGWAGVRYDAYFRYLAQHGYAVVHTDFRGMGCSGGVKRDSFEAQEITDVYDLVEGVAEKDWCNGRVGVWGHSYGGITSLKAAAANPPHLCAIVAIEGSTDPYLGEVMRYGAPCLATISAEWASWMLAMAAMPPLNVGDARFTEAVWSEHLDALKPWQLPWREHPLKDEYWLGREVDPATITTPSMFIISSRDPNPWAWSDFARTPAPKRVICGPWLHGLPEESDRHGIDSMGEMLKWWDRWLKDVDAAPGSFDEPEISVFVLGANTWELRTDLPGEGSTTVYHLNADGTLSREKGESGVVIVPIDFTVGATTGFGGSEYPGEQSDDDVRSALFDGDGELKAIQIFGSPTVRVTTSQLTLDGFLCARLVDVAPCGEAQLITKGSTWLSPVGDDPINESMRTVTIDMYPVRYQLNTGHRLRVALAHTDFPELWPDEPRTNFRVETGHELSTVSVPTVAGLGDPVRFAAPRDELVTAQTRETKLRYDVARSPSGGIEITGGLSSAHDSLSRAHKLSCTHDYRIVADRDDADATVLTTTTTLVVEEAADTSRVVISASTEESRKHFRADVSVVKDAVTVASKSWTAGPRASARVMTRDGEHHG